MGWFAVFMVIFSVSLGVFMLASLTESTLEKEFCPDNITYGQGTIDYCNGRPFVCNRNSCYWVERPVIGESCETRMIGGILSRHCEEVLE